MRLGMAAAALLATLFGGARAEACSLAGNSEFRPDPDAAATDRSPPSAPEVKVQSIRRGKSGSSSCDDLGWIEITVVATDDQSSFEQLGFELSRTSGESAVTMPVKPVSLGHSSSLLLAWSDGATDEQEPLDFSIQVVALDRAGNRSPPSELRITDPGTHGCAGVGGSSVLLAFASVLKRAKRRLRPSQTA